VSPFWRWFPLLALVMFFIGFGASLYWGTSEASPTTTTSVPAINCTSATDC
jgi:hypothetical protein